MAETYDLISFQLLCEADSASEPREAGISSSLTPSLSSGFLPGHRSHAWFSKATCPGLRGGAWQEGGPRLGEEAGLFPDLEANAAPQFSDGHYWVNDCKIFHLSNSSQMRTFAFAEVAALVDLSRWFFWVAWLGRRPDEDG